MANVKNRGVSTGQPGGPPIGTRLKDRRPAAISIRSPSLSRCFTKARAGPSICRAVASRDRALRWRTGGAWAREAKRPPGYAIQFNRAAQTQTADQRQDPRAKRYGKPGDM